MAKNSQKMVEFQESLTKLVEELKEVQARLDLLSGYKTTHEVGENAKSAAVNTLKGRIAMLRGVIEATEKSLELATIGHLEAGDCFED
ncbi:MAG: hypothetical protein ABL899_01310 [Nitrospira sp.]